MGTKELPRPTAETTAVSLHGVIDAQAATEFEKRADALTGDTMIVDLDVFGGLGGDTLRIVRRMRTIPRVVAVVRNRHHCLSSCVMIWAAADSRLVGPEALFAFHGASCVSDLDPLCLAFGRRIFTNMMHDAVPRISPLLAAFLDSRDPPAFERRGRDVVVLTGREMVLLGAAQMLPRAELDRVQSSERPSPRG